MKAPGLLRLGIALAIVVAAIAILTLRNAPTAGSAPDVSPVQDEAGLLSDVQRRAVDAYHRRLLEDWDIDYRVVTRAGLTDINATAVTLFRAFGRASRSGSGRGLLLLVDPTANRVRLEVGYTLEGTFPDAFIDYLERRQMVPFFERGRVADGIVATTELIVGRAREAGADLATTGGDRVTSSGGAGAVNDARIGAGSLLGGPATGAEPDDGGKRAGTREAAEKDAYRPGHRPEETLAAYLRAMASHDGRAELQMYTPATRSMLKGWLVTPAQMDNVVRTYRNCDPGRSILSPDGRRSVIRYPAASRRCAPLFFERSREGWQLDLTMMQRSLRFNAANAWRFEPGISHPYEFAFQDWRFDEHGFPRAHRP